VTAGERLFIEMQLKSIWRKLALQRKKNAALPFIKEIEVLGNQYIRDIIFSGMGTYILAAEKDWMFEEMKAVINSLKVKKKFRTALYKNGDLEEIRRLSIEIREQLERVLKKYEAHTK